MKVFQLTSLKCVLLHAIATSWYTSWCHKWLGTYFLISNVWLVLSTDLCPLQLTSALISSLLDRYAGDIDIFDTISERLRETTPFLFSKDDAIANKGGELVTMATTTSSKDQKTGLLRQSLKV